jgi:predicted GNAT family acetyltransferase
MMADDARVVHNVDAQSFVVEGAEGTAVLTYRELGDHLTILHTKVAPEHEGEGFGGLLVRAALDYARQRKLRVIPACKFARMYIARHAEYADLIDAG